MTPSEVLELIEREGIKTVEVRFTDLRGQWRRLGYAASMVDARLLEDGVMFDGSTIEGWRDVAHSDMLLKPDAGSAVLEPFSAQPSLILIGDVLEPGGGIGYDRCPRSIARRAEDHLSHGGFADHADVAHQAEFFVFDDARFAVAGHESFYAVDAEESPHNSATRYEVGNRGHRPGPNGAPLAAAPVDQGGDLRAEMAAMLEQMGAHEVHHHHDCAPGQNQIGSGFNPLVRAADHFQIYKHVVQSVASSFGKTATFMPRPVGHQPGSGMQVLLRLWQSGRPVFAGNGYADLSESCLHFIGGVLHHGRALNALLNPTTNSYRRLAPGGGGPRHLAFAALNRSAAIRLPFASRPEDKRVEVRFGDPSANPYLAFAALIMAGLDGVHRRLDPGEPIDRNLYDLPPEDVDDVPAVCRTLEMALEALDSDREFLLASDVFTDSLIDAYIALKRHDVEELERAPHPLEYQMYYSV